MTTATPLDAGPLRFARFAYPPNALGYCGPADHRALLEYADAGVADGGLRRLAAGFDGAWPYLELIAGSCGLTDPLDGRVVEAYWIGNRLLDRVGGAELTAAVATRFGPRAGRSAGRVLAAVPAGARPHHNFHVLNVYPWIGLLRAGKAAERALEVLDRCRVRWGRVLADQGATMLAESRPLTWDGTRLALGPPRAEAVNCRLDGYSLAGPAPAGTWVALHWDWVCDRLTPGQLAALRHQTLRHLAIANRARAGDLVA